jgi:glucose/arabinose dehydrogenase
VLSCPLAACSEWDHDGFTVESVATFELPWAMTFLPDGRLLVTEKRGRLFVVDQQGRKSAPVSGMPAVAFGGQGGLGDVAVHPRFAETGWIYLSYAEAGPGDERRAAVARARLNLAAGGGELSGVEVIWRQEPAVDSNGHFGHRLAFAPDGHLFVSSGERKQFDPAQGMTGNLGKIVRLRDDGSVPADNPFADQGGVTAQIWSLGHRNPLGLAFDAQGRLWNTEMGPMGGDELNLVLRGRNYGYPLVSNGDHYSGEIIPDHATRPDLEAPKAWWTPVISPADLVFYGGELFPGWRGNALIPGLSSQCLVRVAIAGDEATEVARYPMGQRIRAVAEGPDGSIWLLEDREQGRLLRLRPR